MMSSSIYTVSRRERFLRNAFRVPRAVQKKPEKDVLPPVDSGPTQPDPPTLKNFIVGKTAWGYRIGNYLLGVDHVP